MTNVIMSGLTRITTITIFDSYDSICAIIDDLKNTACWLHHALPKNRFLKALCYGFGFVVVTRSLPFIFRRTNFFKYFDREIIFFHRSSGHSKVMDIKKELLKELKDENTLPKDKDGKLVLLELNAGSGNNISYYPEDCVIVATDTLEEMKEKFDENILLKSDWRYYGFLICSCETLDSIPDETISCCVCFYSLCSTRSVARALQEIRRVLMPGGKVYFIEHVREYKKFSSMWFLQINFMPSLFLIGCCVRNLEEYINNAGFQNVSLSKCQIDLSNYNKPMQAFTPHLYGCAIK